jgi:hypothetical protein
MGFSLTRPSAEEHYKYVGYILAGLSGYIFMHDHGPLGAGETVANQDILSYQTPDKKG